MRLDEVRLDEVKVSARTNLLEGPCVSVKEILHRKLMKQEGYGD